MPYVHEPIKNKATVEFVLCDKPYCFTSNEVEAKKIDIEVIKEQNCEYVFDNDVIKYTVKIINSCDVDLCDVEFIDCISTQTCYETGTFCINGQKVTPYVNENTIKYVIPEIKGGHETVIDFSVKVL